MFVLRSAFWLTIGFLVMAPYGTDLGAAATTLKDQAIAVGLEAGQQAIAEHVFDAKRLPDLLLSSAASADISTLASSTMLSVFPHPRPASLG